MNLSWLVHFNASLNLLATVLLITGLVLIRRGKVCSHRRCMLSAFGASALFLVCYVVHYIWRASIKGGAHTPYHGDGLIRMLYYVLLVSHILLAMTVPVIAIRLIRLGMQQRIDRHRRLARYGYPIWLYVSMTGVVIYLMLYHLNPAPK